MVERGGASAAEAPPPTRALMRARRSVMLRLAACRLVASPRGDRAAPSMADAAAGVAMGAATGAPEAVVVVVVVVVDADTEEAAARRARMRASISLLDSLFTRGLVARARAMIAYTEAGWPSIH